MNGLAKHVVCVAGFCWAAIFTAGVTGAAHAADWPMYRFNAERQGYTPEKLPDKLQLRWLYKPDCPASAAGCNQPVVAGGRVFFGSSADCKVYALDAATGKEKWTFFTEGPVRFAPAAWRDRIFVGSDDGYLYCLEAATGKLLWKKRGGPSGEKILGEGRVVSRWPVRGGVVVLDDKVYFGAGIWSADTTYLTALDAATGKKLWVTEAKPERKIAFRGYIAAAGNSLVCPDGAITPTVFDRTTGKPLYSKPTRTDPAVVIVDNLLFWLRGSICELESGKTVFYGRGTFRPATVTATPKWIAWTSGWPYSANISVRERGKLMAPNPRRPGRKSPSKGKNIFSQAGWNVLIGAGSKFYADKSKRERGNLTKAWVVAIDPETADKRKGVWSAPVEGEVRGLAVAGGRLYVATTRGFLYCFGAAEAGHKPETISPKRTGMPASAGGVCSKAAEEILKQAGITEGYCVDLGCGDGSLTYELLKKSKLYVVAVEKDAAKVEQARRRLDAAGLYGVRTVVLQADPAKSGLPKWFANLVVSSRSVQGAGTDGLSAEAARIQRPYGGVAIFGKPGAMKKNVRGPLAGGGSWTHGWGDAANTACSGDRVLKGPLRTFWYRSSGFPIPRPHASGEVPVPLVAKGRCYVIGCGVQAIDAYNGRVLWERKVDIPRTIASGGGPGHVSSAYFACVSQEDLYVRCGAEIRRFEGTTGKQLGTFRAPPLAVDIPGRWIFVAYENGLLFGALAAKESVPDNKRKGYGWSKTIYGKKGSRWIYTWTEAAALTVLEPATGKTKWVYKAKHSIPTSSIAIGGGKVYLIDRPIPPRKKGCFLLLTQRGPGDIVALNAADGKEVWRQTVADMDGHQNLTLGVKRGILILSFQALHKGQPWYVWYGRPKLVAFQTADGKRLWEKSHAHYSARPILIGNTVYAHGDGVPFSYDVMTGKPLLFRDTGKPLVFKRAKACGKIVASQNLLVFRSWSLAWVNLLGDGKLRHYAGIRNDCFINAIPAGGLVIMPEIASGCGCPFQRAWVALQGAE